jgi:hypothetical protein
MHEPFVIKYRTKNHMHCMLKYTNDTTTKTILNEFLSGHKQAPISL